MAFEFVKRLSCALCACAALGPFFVSAADGKKPVFLNVDDTHFYQSRGRLGIDIGEREIREMVSKYRGTDVTDLVLCAGGRLGDVPFPGGKMEALADKYEVTREIGRDVSYTNIPFVRAVHAVWRKGLDPFAIWIDEARRAGMRPWLSLRVNDCHGSTEETSPLHPQFYYDHSEYRRVTHRPRLGWFDIGYDFAHAEVRERMLDYLVRLMDRYDVEGLEIDWLREAFCFVPGRERAETLTDFMRRVRAAADRAGAKRGRRLGLMARVPEDPETGLLLGLDASTWAHEGLVDVLVPAPRWRTADVNVPVGLWRRLVRGTNVRIVPGLEILLCERRDVRYYITPEQLLGIVAVNYANGADGAYVYNLFDDPCWQDEAKRWWRIGDQPNETLAVFWPNQLKWLALIGSPEKVMAAPRDHVLTFRDLQPEWRRTSLEPEWNTADEPFPTRVEPANPRYFRVPTGLVASDRALVVRIGIDTPDPALPKVFVNGRACRFLRTETCVPAHTRSPLYVFEVNAKDYAETAAVVELLAEKPLDLSYMDVIVR